MSEVSTQPASDANTPHEPPDACSFTPAVKRALDTSTEVLLTTAHGKRRATEGEHEHVRQPVFEDIEEGEESDNSLDEHNDGQNALDLAFAAFSAKHEIDINVFHTAEWTAVIDALHRVPDPVGQLQLAPIHLRNRASIDALKKQGVVWA